MYSRRSSSSSSGIRNWQLPPARGRQSGYTRSQLLHSQNFYFAKHADNEILLQPPKEKKHIFFFEKEMVQQQTTTASWHI
jgi:hypothetical protein